MYSSKNKPWQPAPDVLNMPSSQWVKVKGNKKRKRKLNWGWQNGNLKQQKRNFKRKILLEKANNESQYLLCKS